MKRVGNLYQIISSMDGSRCLVDRENPRTEIWISEMDMAQEEQSK